MDDFSSSLIIDPVKYAASEFALHPFTTFDDTKRGSIDNPALISMELVPLTEVALSVRILTIL